MKQGKGRGMGFKEQGAAEKGSLRGKAKKGGKDTSQGKVKEVRKEKPLENLGRKRGNERSKPIPVHKDQQDHEGLSRGQADRRFKSIERAEQRQGMLHGNNKKNALKLCPVSDRCGGCQYLGIPYEEQLARKQREMEQLLKDYCKIHPIMGMENPFHYRNKVHAVFSHDRKGNPVSGVYEAGSHRVVPIETCLIEDQVADGIIGTIRGMLKPFKIKTYDEDTGYGIMRHVLVRRGFATGQVMVVLVTADPIFPSRNNFVKALRQSHPEITTIIQNINGQDTSMVLGKQERILFGKGYIEDRLCGCIFRISSKSFYQVNPVQTEKLYSKALEMAGLTGQERVIDAYCGIGTISLIAAKSSGEVIGVELNPDAVRDAISNAKRNQIENVRFFTADAGDFMCKMADQGEEADVVFMDPPRSGSTEEFIRAVAGVKARRVVYISCGPETLARDLKVFCGLGYEVAEGWVVDMFGMTNHVETVALLVRKP